MDQTFNLEERRINFAVNIIKLSEILPASQAANHISNQIIKSGIAPALHYGEAQAGESRNDFIHKMKVALKELKETFNCLFNLLLSLYPEHSIFLQTARQPYLVSFLSIIHQHKRSIRRDGSKVVGKHGKLIVFPGGIEFNI